MSDPFKWSSPTGQALCQQILKETRLSYEPHDCQIEGVCQSLDGVNLLAITPTGSDKTSYYIMYILVVLAVINNPLLCPTAKFPKNPCLIVICPTIPLQLEMVSKILLGCSSELTILKASKMDRAGINVVSINSATRDAASRLREEELCVTAWTNGNAIVAGPEQLKLKEFEQALLDDLFWVRVCGLGFDEVHLLNIWGPRFRKDFLQMGFVKVRLNDTHCPWIML